jgi:cytochrome d ubiquinol oxidase subunit II
MQALQPYLPDIWIFLIAFFLLYYAITDGSDLGAGIISFFSQDENERGLMMATVENTWHANQTWLVILGGMLFGAFPLFYGLVLSSLYIPILLMLFGLAMRGIAFEFRGHSEQKHRWGIAFSLGSLITTLAQGFALGGLLEGLEIKNGVFVGSVFDWISPFSLMVTVGVLFGYVMLGANYLIMKTLGELQEKSYRYSWLSSTVTLLISTATYAWSLKRFPFMADKWSNLSEHTWISALSILTVISFGMFFRSIWKRREVAPIFWNAAIIIFSFACLSVSLYPYMIPHVISPTVTIADAAASPKTLSFMLVVSGILLPIILTYTTYEFWVFRGKATRSYGEYED